ncbi:MULTISPECIES: glycosyltransferase [Micrococcaceae]|uniref:glycosyltransferase n=1 Tax=Micrococcaceae TaxID=1268 RepID=UPI000A5EC2FC|nr:MULTISPECIES: glycosyltransferase [Micrococcaceae]
MNGHRLSVLIAHPSADLYGADKVLLETVEGLLRGGARVLVTVPAEGPLVAELQGRGAAVVLCPTPVLRRSMLTPSGATRFTADAIRGTAGGIGLIRRCKPDVLLANTSTVPLWAALARLCGVPAVVHVHEAEAYAPRLQQALLALPLSFATSIVANSQFTADTLVRSLPSLQGRSTVIYNGVPGPATEARSRGRLDGGLRVLYVGRLSHRKGVDVVVEAIAQLNRKGHPTHLDVVGGAVPGADAYELDLRQRVAGQGAGASVAFHGYQSDVWPFLADADVAVVPSRLDESFGNTAVEAILAARPLVASSISGLREAAGAYDSVQFVAPGSVQGLADALETVASQWAVYRSAAARDASLARAKHSPVLYGEEMFRHLSQATGQA